MSEDFLSRWSRLKRTGGAPKAPAPSPRGPLWGKDGPVEGRGGGLPLAATPPPVQPLAPAPPPLPSIESLEPGAEIAQFMRAEVEEGLKRQAFRKLLQDPRFNVMDGLDVYIDDYSKPDPLPEGWLEKMNQTARFGDYQEPVPEEGTEAQEGSEAQASPSVAAPAPEEAPDADKESAAGSPEGSEPIHTSNTEASHAPRAEFPRPS